MLDAKIVQNRISDAHAERPSQHHSMRQYLVIHVRLEASHAQHIHSEVELALLYQQRSLYVPARAHKLVTVANAQL